MSGKATFRWIAGLVALVAAAYAGVVVYFHRRQVDMIFMGNITQGRPEFRIATPPPWLELRELRSARGERIVVGFAKAARKDGTTLDDAASRPTLLCFHASGRCLKVEIPTLDALRRDGQNVMMPEYLGYGMNEGIAGEAACLETAELAYQSLIRRPDIDPRRVIVAGGSLGSGVAIALTARHPEVIGLISMSGFTSVSDLAKERYWWLPIDLTLEHPFRSVDRIREVKCPILITHGDRDDYVPYAMARRLADAAGPNASVLPIPGRDHYNTMYVAGPSGGLDPDRPGAPVGDFPPEVHDGVRAFYARTLKAAEARGGVGG